jgi:NAD(P)-dependent dehydrogenase (short-subunit alcohol dehydrogenase family)
MKQTILITGSSTGIGKATAKFFHEKGWNVVATMRTPEKETELKRLDNVLVTRLDVLDLDSIKAAIKEGIEKFGKIDVVVNNAGYGAYGPLESFPRENIIRQFNTNVTGLLDVTREIIPHFRKNKNGVLINISSVGGRITFPLGSLYHGTKFAVEGISESLNYEMEQIGCKVKIIEPGAINTDFAGRSFDFNYDKSLTEYRGTVDTMMKAVDNLLQYASDAELVAEVIYEAATDGTNKLRYTAGPDAKEYLEARKNTGDEEFFKNLKAHFAV